MDVTREIVRRRLRGLRLLCVPTIVVNESISRGRNFASYNKSAPEFDWLHLTGGAIGQGLPVAVGAAVSYPGRKVLSLQADRSAMFTLQSRCGRKHGISLTV